MQLKQDTDLAFRQATDHDVEDLFRIFASTRADELKLVDWTESMKHAFLQQQFTAQHQHYHQANPNAEFLIFAFRERTAGRLYLNRTPTNIHIIDIAVLPEYRNLGIGSGILTEIIEEARLTNRSVTIGVEKFNPALQLYTRLGFEVLDDSGPVYMKMIHNPANPPVE